MISRIYRNSGDLLKVRWAKEIARRKAGKTRLAVEMILNPTKLEMLLQFHLRKVVNGRVEIQPQCLLAGYIVDFYIPRLQLAFEADGPRHKWTERYDRDRDEHLSRIQVKTIRFTEKFLRQNKGERIQEAIRDALNARQKELRSWRTAQ